MEPLEEGMVYHIYNRGNNKQPIFFEERNYKYFLKLAKEHLLPVVDFYSYCVLQNHFHFLIKIKEGANNPSQQFSNLFNAYTKAINKEYNRTGSLFQRPFRRKKVKEEEYLQNLVIYIHLNPSTHKLLPDYRQYSYSSYQELVGNKYSIVQRKEVLEWFEGVENFILAHEQRKAVVGEILDDVWRKN